MGVPRFHFRSVSLPSRVQPINASKNEPHLLKLQSCLSQTLPITSQAIQSDLEDVEKLYNSVAEAAKSPSTTQQRELMEESLESSIGLLDSCNIVKELVQTTKENVQTLQSALGRKGLDSSVQYDIITYTYFRKRTNKSIAKTLKALKSLENKNGSDPSLSGYDQSFIRVLKEVTCFTIAILKCILLFLSSSTSKHGGRSLVSRLMMTKPVASVGDDAAITEVGSVDFALRTLHKRIKNDGAKVDEVQILQKELQNLDVCIEGFEKRLERLFRLLVRSRVTVLNILTDLN